MAFNPTDMQKLAIDTRGNVLVSAAAGSGKTAVLVERVAKLLTDKENPISADRLLIVTFTNAAAAEMRSRIEKRIFDEIQQNPNDANLQQQKYLLQNADICTIDSFCIKLVRENFEKCGIEPDFKISDGSDLTDICKKTMANLMVEQLENPNRDFEHLLELCNCEYDEKGLTQLIERIYNYSQQMPFPQKFVDGLLTPYKTVFAQGNAWYDMAFDEAIKNIDGACLYLQKMSEVAQHVQKGVAQHVDCANQMVETVESLKSIAHSRDWDSFVQSVQFVKFPSAPRASKDDESATVFKFYKAKVNDVVKSLKDIFCADSETVQADILKDAGAVELLVRLITDYSQKLFSAFCEENTFTFYNMEQLALGLLCEYKNGEIIIRDEARELCNRYDEVLVDEFQDVNDLQDMLFYVLSNREKKLFVVGDIKQSIYGFRGSNPENFLKKKNRYVPIDKLNDGDSKKIILSDNFRSRKGVCDAVNFFFTELMAGQCGSIIYNQDERLNAGGDFPKSDAPTAEILVVDKCDDESEDSLLQTEAQKIAQYINSVMNEGAVITDGKELRNACYSDFAILLNTFKDKANIIGDALKGHGIPVAVSGESFMDSIEISSVMSLLQVIDNPKNDVALLQVMMSPTFAFTADEMAGIRAKNRKCPLYSSVVDSAKNGNDKCTDFIQRLSTYRRDAAVLSVDRLISKLIYSTDILNWVSALPGGKSKKDKLFTLIDYAKSYAAHSDGGIYGFIKYMKSLPATSFKNASSNSENAVKIMTMHNSKGLQFPVCIVANLSSKINQTDAISREIFSEKGGIAFKYYDENQFADVEMFGHKVMANASRINTVEEKLRLLYVAATRAIDRVCFVCSSNNLESKLINLSKAIMDEPPYIARDFLEKGLYMSDWILSCALLHPNGDVLRNFADVKAPLVPSKATIKITIVKGEEKVEIVRKEPDKTVQSSDDFVASIKQNVAYQYPYEKLRNLQAKASVSRLVHAADDDRYAFAEKPAFMLGDKLAGAARGSAMHHVMQFIALTQNVNVQSEIERLLEWKFITNQEAASIDICAIETFFKSNLYRRIISCKDNVHRELRFLSEIPATRIDPTINLEVEDANIIVQGAIDLCFIENDGIVVLDFKTDRVENLDALVKCYGEQLDIYSAAAQKIFGLPVKEKIIYSFHLGESISF